MNIFQKINKLIDLSIESAEAAIRGHNAAEASFKKADHHALIYYQDFLRQREKENVIFNQKLQYLEQKDRTVEETQEYQTMLKIKQQDLC